MPKFFENPLTIRRCSDPKFSDLLILSFTAAALDGVVVSSKLRYEVGKKSAQLAKLSLTNRDEIIESVKEFFSKVIIRAAKRILSDISRSLSREELR